jgi:uncharacterized surface protein with fasciclin (FAS1) repeats
MKKVFQYSFSLFAAALMLAGCKKNDAAPTAPTLDAFLKSRPDLSIFDSALNKANLQTFRQGKGPFTWLVPTNDAFTAAGLTLDSITRMKPGDVSYLIMYHMINAAVMTRDMIAQNSFARTTNMGSAVYLGQNGENFFVNGSRITSPDIQVSNGYVHVLNRVNIPPALRSHIQVILNSTGQHSLFIQALTKANRWAQLTGSTFTVFAPTDAAMNAAGLTSAAITAAPVARVDSIVRYHYLSNIRLFTSDLGDRTTPQTALGAGRTLQASAGGMKLKGRGNATPVDIIRGDILGMNGVVHVINGVLQY